MTFKKPHPHILTVWRLRLLLFTLLPSFISACFLPRINWMWWLFTAVWALSFLYLYIFYYPIKYKKLSYSLTELCLLVHCGVIYTRVKAMPFTSIQYVSISSTPLQRLFDVSTMFVYSAGSSVHISGMTHDDAEALRCALSPEDEETEKHIDGNGLEDEIGVRSNIAGGNCAQDAACVEGSGDGEQT